MKTFLIFLLLLVLSRIETNEATRNLDKTHLLLPSLQTRPPIKTPSPNPGTEAASVNMASTVTERNFVGHKKVVFTPPINAYPLGKTDRLLPSLMQTRPPIKTPSSNPGTEASVNMTSTVTERNFVGRKEVVFTPPPPSAYPLDKTHLILPSLIQTRPPVKTPSPNPGTEASVNMASTVTERNFAGRKEVSTTTTNAYHLDKTHLLLPSLQTRPPVKTPSSNPGTEASVNDMTSTITARH